MNTKCSNETKVAIAWHGLPIYAATAIKAGISLSNCSVKVLGTKPAVPFNQMERIIGKKVFWLKEEETEGWEDLNLVPPDIFFVSGWGGVFERLTNEVIRCGGKVISLSDRTWHFNYRNIRNWLKFQRVYRKRIDSIWVPGIKGVKNARIYGIKKSNIYSGVYTCDPNIFTYDLPLLRREKKFIFIGRYEPVKNIANLVKAFVEFLKKEPGWILETYGCGSLIEKLKGVEGIHCREFLQPEDLAEKLKLARFLILPSLREPWGVVIHEACSCGCGLIVSDNIGALDDLGSSANMFTFKASSISQFVDAMCKAANLSSIELKGVEEASLLLSKKISPEIWAKVFVEIIKRYSN